MQEKANSTCAICGKSYYVCMSCKDIMAIKPYKVHTDTAEHYKIFEILRAFNLGAITKEDAKKKLSKVDLSDKDTFRESTKELLEKVLTDETKNVTNKK